MKILVLGSSGFIGKNFIELKKNSNKSYFYFSNTKKKWDKVKFTQCDLNNYREFDNKIKNIKPDLCLDFSWHGIPDYTTKTNRINLSIKKKIFKALIKNNCKKIISIGSCWEYGDHNGVTKNTEINKRPKNDFVKTKLKVLKLLSDYHKKKLVDYIWLRIFFVYDNFKKKTSLLQSIVKNFKKKNKFYLKNKYFHNDFIYINDVIRYIEAFLNKDKLKSGVYNLGYGKTFSNNNFVKTFNNLAINKYSISKLNYSNKKGLISDMRKTNRYLKLRPKYNVKKGLKDFIIKTKLK